MRRLVTETDDAFELALLRSAKNDAPPSDSEAKAAIVLGAAAVTVGAAATGSIATATATASGTANAGTAKAGALAGKLGAIAIWKWVGLGIIVGSAVTMGTEHAVRHGGPSVEHVAAAAPVVEMGVSSNVSTASTASATNAADPTDAGEPSNPTNLSRMRAAPGEGVRIPTSPHDAVPPSAAVISAEIVAISAPPVVAPSASAVATPAPNASALVAEVAALDRARRALAAKDPAEAIRILDVYERDVPVRALGPEAQVLRIEAVAARGDAAEAKRLGGQFLLVYPRDPHAERVRRLLASMSNL